MNDTHYLADTSAIVRLANDAAVRVAWQHRLVGGKVGVCAMTELDILSSIADGESLAPVLGDLFTTVEMPDQVLQRAAEIQSDMVGTPHPAHPVDLILAATADLHGLTLLHDNAGFTAVAEITGQRTEWVA